MLSLSNNLISNILISIFGVSTVAFFTNFWANLGADPTIDAIVNSPGSLPVAIFSFVGALITFFIKQATSIKNIETSIKNVETGITQLVSEIKEDRRDKRESGVELNKHMKKMVALQKEHLKGVCTESQVGKIPRKYWEDDEEHEE